MLPSGLERSDRFNVEVSGEARHAEPLAPRAEEINQMIGSRAVWSAATDELTLIFHHVIMCSSSERE